MAKPKKSSPPVPFGGEVLLYQTEDGETRWLTQVQIAELFQTTPQNITLNLKAIYDDGELLEKATCKEYLQVRQEGLREVSRELLHYRLEAILAVGFRVRSQRGISRLEEYLRKGFTMDDERLKNPPGAGVPDYFDELLERIRDIRSSERQFYQKVLDFYSISVDCQSKELSPRCEVQKVCYAWKWACSILG